MPGGKVNIVVLVLIAFPGRMTCLAVDYGTSDVQEIATAVGAGSPDCSYRVDRGGPMSFSCE